MTPAELKAKVTVKSPHFFSRNSMKFFGDTMSNYGYRAVTVTGIEAWELWRKRPVKYGLQNSHYFCKKTYRHLNT